MAATAKARGQGNAVKAPLRAQANFDLALPVNRPHQGKGAAFERQGIADLTVENARHIDHQTADPVEHHRPG